MLHSVPRMGTGRRQPVAAVNAMRIIGSSNSRFDNVILPFVLGGLLCVVLMIVNPGWNYNPVGFVDDSVYLGHSFDFPALPLDFPGAPSGDLLPLILPGAAAYKLLSPVWANLSFDFFFFTVSVCFFYFVLLKTIGVRGAIFGAVALATYRYFLFATGSDYTTGKVVAYLILSLFAITKAGFADDRLRRHAWSTVTGFFCSLMVYTAILGLVYIPALLLFYVLLTGRKKRLAGVLAQTCNSCLFMLAGFMLGTVMLGGVHFTYAHTFWFFTNSIRKLFFILSSERCIKGYGWIAGATWLVLPASVTIVSLIGLFRTFHASGLKHHIVRSFYLMNALVLAVMVCLYLFRNQ